MKMKDIELRSMRVKQEDRAILSEVIPLPSPFQLVIDSTNACNFKCQFCPTGDIELIKKHARPFGNMPIELFKKIIDDCKGFPVKIKRIDFGKDGEPLVNKNFAEMVSYAKASDVADMIAVTTNGALLNEKTTNKLLSSGIDMIKISIEAVTDAGYKRLTKVDVKYSEMIEKVRYLNENKADCKIGVKIIDFNLSLAEKEKFYSDFTDLCDYIGIDQASGWSLTEQKDFTLGSKPKSYLDLPHFNRKEVCPLPFFTLSINFNGEVSICCVDWAHETIVGDLSKENIVDLWNGDRLYAFRKMHLEGKRHLNKACADCFAINGSIDNLDPHATLILEKINSQR